MPLGVWVLCCQKKLEQAVDTICCNCLFSLQSYLEDIEIRFPSFHYKKKPLKSSSCGYSKGTVPLKPEELCSLPEALVGKTGQVLLIIPLLPNLF